mgnify:FL=1
MKKQGMGGSAFFVGEGWLGLPPAPLSRQTQHLTPGCGRCRAGRLRTCMKKNTIQLSFGLL